MVKVRQVVDPAGAGELVQHPRELVGRQRRRDRREDLSRESGWVLRGVGGDGRDGVSLPCGDALERVPLVRFVRFDGGFHVAFVYVRVVA